MKQVWILNHYAQEPGGVGGTRHFSLSRHLPAHGWTATIIAASTDHAAGGQRLSGDDAFRLQVADGVPFLWLKTRSYSGNGADRIGNMIDYTRAVLRQKNLEGIEKPDAIIGSSVHPLAAWAGCRLAKRYGVPFIFEVRDLWPQTLIDMGRLSPRHPMTIALRWLERSLYRQAARIVVLLPRAHDYIEPLGIPSEKIVWIPNGVDTKNFAMQPLRHFDGDFTLMYFGAHGSANGLTNLLDAMGYLSADPAGQGIALRLIGDGPLKSSLIASAREKGLMNVRFEDPVSKDKIPELASHADAFVFNLVDAPVFKYGISSNKLFDFLAAGRPVLFCCSSSNNPVSEAGAGITVAPEDPKALADAILRLAALSSEERVLMGARGRQHLESNYDMSLLAEKLAFVLDGTLGPW